MSAPNPNGRVFGIEADQNTYEFAMDNVLVNGLGQIATVLHAAAWDNAEEITLYRRLTRSANTSISEVPADFTNALGEPPNEAFVVKGMRIDDLLPAMSNRVDFLKVDVEGAEPKVLRGARKTIEANLDISVLMEWSPGQISQAGFDIGQFLAEIENMGLSFFEISGSELRSLTRAEVTNLPYRAGIVLKRQRLALRGA
jgi:FkbM family methyltransferase